MVNDRPISFTSCSTSLRAHLVSILVKCDKDTVTQRSRVLVRVNVIHWITNPGLLSATCFLEECAYGSIGHMFNRREFNVFFKILTLLWYASYKNSSVMWLLFEY